MMQIQRLFTDHPATVGETYWQHFGMALSFSGRMLVAASCCAVHAVFPFLFVKTGSQMITDMHDRMVTNRSRLLQDAEAAAAPRHRDQPADAT